MSSGIHALAIPKWGIEMENGTVTSWHSNVGDSVTKGDELVDIESDKIMNTLEATATGVLKRVLLEEGDTLGVGELIGIIADEDASDDAIDAFIAEFNAALGKSDSTKPEATKVAATSGVATTAADPAPAATSAAPTKVRVSPPVRRLAEKLAVDIATVVGSGPNGRITSADVEAAASGASADTSSETETAPAAKSADEYTATALNATQQTIAGRLVESKQSVPHFYLSVDIKLDALLQKRQALNADQKQKVSINDLIVWCTARALMATPQINAQLVGNEVRQFKHADIAVAVATDRGLLTPIIRAAEEMSPLEISSNIAGMIEKAKNGGLERNDIVGGSFTVSNLGMYGVDSFDAIINPPQVAILALGKAKKQVVVGDDDDTSVATILSANLSSDHRVVDGALGGKFLSALKSEMEAL